MRDTIGEARRMSDLRPCAVCRGSEFEMAKRHGIPYGRCAGCGARQQRIDTTEEALEKWYRETYHQGVYRHGWEEDYAAAKVRVAAYSGKLSGRVLDVGAGNGAFVQACHEAGVEAWGQELAEGEMALYRERLTDCAFPTEHFRVVTCHDVLEHVLDPRSFLAELHRLVEPQGWLILDFPDFSFERHWKRIEHIWLLRREELLRLLDECGFEVRYWTVPVEGKFTIYSKPVKRARQSVLLPPGIGDSYWSIVKLPGLMKALGQETMDAWVADGGDNRRRSLEWVQKIPWLKAAGYRTYPLSDARFREAYMEAKRYWFRDVAGCDHFLAFNGRMRFGADIDLLEERWGSDWYPRLFVPLEEREAEARYREEFGRYVVAFFVPHGMYKDWLKEMPLRRIKSEVLDVLVKRGYTVLFMGAQWDVQSTHYRLAEDYRRQGCDKVIDLSGKTTLPEMFGLLRGACGVVGWPAGNTIMATMLKRPTLLYWNRYFDERFWRYACPPDSRGRWYVWQDTAKVQPGAVGEWVDGFSE